MTVLHGNEVRGFTGTGRRFAIGLLVVIALGAAFGVSRVIDDNTGATYEGPMVERSLAMQSNIDALVEGAWPAPVGVSTYEGPMVERSLAMDEYYKEQPLLPTERLQVVSDNSLATEAQFRAQEAAIRALGDQSLAAEARFRAQEAATRVLGDQSLATEAQFRAQEAARGSDTRTFGPR